MASRNQTDTITDLTLELTSYLQGQLDTNLLVELKDIIIQSGNVPPLHLEQCKTFFQLWRKLEQRKCIRPEDGDCGFLKKWFSLMGQLKLLDRVKKYEDEIKRVGETVPILSQQSCGNAPSRGGGDASVSEVPSPRQLYLEELKKKSQPINSDNGMSLYQVPLVMTKEAKAERIRMFDIGWAPALSKPEKIILLLGAVGAGKSTLINGLFNYVIGVEWAEKSRFELVPDCVRFENLHHSPTQSVTVYTLHRQSAFNIPYTIRVIDTPGFGDTEGINRDKLITQCIRNLFTNKDYGTDHIDAIGFVAQSSLARLTPTQKYIFDSILSFFGKDIADNIFLLFTHCDSQIPPVLAAIQEAKKPFKSYFKFNNSALFARNDTKDSDVDKLFWKIGFMSFKKFLSELENVEGKSLTLTKEVLEERQQLEVHVSGIQKTINEGLTQLEQFKVEVDAVKQHEADIEKNKDFTYTVKEHKMVKVDLEPGKHVTNCLTCNRTCHYPCTISSDEDKARCSAMDGSGNCAVCPENCTWKLHRNVPFRIEVEVVQVMKTAEELKRRYATARGEKMNAEKLTKRILEDFCNLEMNVLHMTGEVRKCLERLSEIALRPSPLSTVEFIDILIKSERAEAKPGFQARIDQLEMVKDQAIAVKRMAEEGYEQNRHTLTESTFEQNRHTLKLAKTAHQRPSLDAEAADIRKTGPSPLSTVEFIDILIKSERAEAKPGFQARIDQLERVKDQAIALERMNEKGYDPFEQYRETLKLTKTAHQRPSRNAEAADVRKTMPSTSLCKKLNAMFLMKNP